VMVDFGDVSTSSVPDIIDDIILQFLL